MERKEILELIEKYGNVIRIDNNMQGATYINFKKLKPFQGKLKERTEINTRKLITSILTKGIFDVRKIWKKGNEYILADGHQTTGILHLLFELVEEGILTMVNKSDNTKSECIPCTFINAENEKDLAEKILIINSDYGKITEKGLEGFNAQFGVGTDFLEMIACERANIPIEVPNEIMESFQSLSLPQGFELAAANEIEETSEPPKERESKEGKTLKFALSEENYAIATEMLKRVKTNQLFEGNEDALMHILSQYETYCLEIN